MIGSSNELVERMAFDNGGVCKVCKRPHAGHRWQWGHFICTGTWVIINYEVKEIWQYPIGEWKMEGKRLVNKRNGTWCDEWTINGKPRKFRKHHRGAVRKAKLSKSIKDGDEEALYDFNRWDGK